MKNLQNKALQFIYQDVQIHFALQNEGNVMVNATEMAKLFNKKTELFLKSAHAKAFINEANLQPNGGRLIENKGRNGIYFKRKLALKFAAWLDVKFELWVFDAIDKLLFGNYKKHWNAHQTQIDAEKEAALLEIQLKKAPTAEMANKYFDTLKIIQKAKNSKRKAIANQLTMEF